MVSFMLTWIVFYNVYITIGACPNYMHHQALGKLEQLRVQRVAISRMHKRSLSCTLVDMHVFTM